MFSLLTFIGGGESFGSSLMKTGAEANAHMPLIMLTPMVPGSP